MRLLSEISPFGTNKPIIMNLIQMLSLSNFAVATAVPFDGLCAVGAIDGVHLPTATTLNSHNLLEDTFSL